MSHQETAKEKLIGHVKESFKRGNCKKDQYGHIYAENQIYQNDCDLTDQLIQKYINCDYDLLFEWIEYQFGPSMNWDNQGSFWHLDNFFPISNNDFANQYNIYKVYNWSNLIPSEVNENKEKFNNDPDELEIIIHYEMIQRFKKELPKRKIFKLETPEEKLIRHVKESFERGNCKKDRWGITYKQNQIYQKDCDLTDELIQKYMGCDYIFLFKWIEFQFDPSMNWENQGFYWHLDHLLPLSKFNFDIEENIYKVFKWQNLRPLEATENMVKFNNLPKDSEIQKHEEKINQFLPINNHLI